jgi:hypothetical protein
VEVFDSASKRDSAKSLSYVATDGQSASLSWNEAPIWGLRPDIYYSLTITVLFLWGPLSDERMALSFVNNTGPRQRNPSWVPVPLSRDHILLSQM